MKSDLQQRNAWDRFGQSTANVIVAVRAGQLITSLGTNHKAIMAGRNRPLTTRSFMLELENSGKIERRELAGFKFSN